MEKVIEEEGDPAVGTIDRRGTASGGSSRHAAGGTQGDHQHNAVDVESAVEEDDEDILNTWLGELHTLKKVGYTRIKTLVKCGSRIKKKRSHNRP